MRISSGGNSGVRSRWLNNEIKKTVVNSLFFDVTYYYKRQILFTAENFENFFTIIA